MPLLMLVVLAGASTCTQHGIQARRGSWEIEYSARWSTEAHRRLWEYSLYRHRGTERVFVAEHIRGYDYYPDDCIVFHASGPEAAGYFAACGDRRPLRLSGPDDGWRKLGNTLQKLELKGGQTVVVQRREMAEILLQAKAQPELAAEGNRR